MKLPHGDQALMDAELFGYCLNPYHPRGRHKARVFESVLGITRLHTPVLKHALLTAAATGDAVEGESDSYGRRYVLDFEFAGPVGTGLIRSAWIIRSGEYFPRLATCYVLS